MTSLTEHQQEGQEVFYVFALFGVIKTIKIPISVCCSPAASRIRNLNTCITIVSKQPSIYANELHLYIFLTTYLYR